MENNIPTTWFEKETALRVVRFHIANGKLKIRIAAGFFTIKGYNLLRSYLKTKKTYILVGLDDPGEERLRKALIMEIMKDLRKGIDEDRRAAVQELINKIQSGDFFLVDARAMDHHGKLFLIDQITAIVSSSNLTGRGLIESVEAGAVVTNPSEVVDYVNKYDEYFGKAYDITRDLLAALLKWLQFASPWEVYLKTMLALEDLGESKRTYKPPVSYQVDVIARTLRQLREYWGAMVVASTGLGKTVIGTWVALRLFEAGEITHVMVIGPKVVKENWERDMLDAGLPMQYFIPQTLDQVNSERDSNLSQFEYICEHTLGKKWLIIVDECHEFRKRYSIKLIRGKYIESERRGFTRILSLINKTDCKVVLLTGSPFSTSTNNINDQLALLPPTKTTDFPKELFELPSHEHWHISSATEFINLPVGSLLTTPHVAKYYSEEDEKGIYINFSGEKRYIPRVKLHRVDFPLLLETEMCQALEKGLFKLHSRYRKYRSSIETRVRIAWVSSPWALRDTLQKIIDTPEGKQSYNVEFSQIQSIRKEYLSPILEKINKLTYKDDPKLNVFLERVTKYLSEKNKIIVFCEMWATVPYLANALTKRFSNIKIAYTITGNELDGYEMRSDNEIKRMIKSFAPVANEAVGKYAHEYDIFISTDAHGVGISMQDAPVVINYDIAWTPIDPTQRAGRILRPWKEPRTVELYAFVPVLSKENQLKHQLQGIKRRWEQLIVRHSESKQMVELPILPTAPEHEIYIPDEARNVRVESADLDMEDLGDADISPFYKHTSNLQANRDFAKTIPDDIISSKSYNGNHPLIFVLIQYKGKYEWPIFNLATKQIEKKTDVGLLDLIACQDNTSVPWYEWDLVEKWSNWCIKEWIKQNEADPNEVFRICTLFLKPEKSQYTLENLLKQ